jgi:tetratricopeptide (TPR) repeat protein
MRISGLMAILLVVSPGARGDEDRAAEMQKFLQAGEAKAMRAEYDSAREAYESAWKLAGETAPTDAVRYDVLKRLTEVYAASGRYAEADNYLQQALTWRENQFGPTDPQFLDDLIQVFTLCRRMKDYDRALVVLDRVWGLHVRASGLESTPVADDMSRKALVYLDKEDPASAVAALNAALTTRTKLNGAASPLLLADLDRLGATYVTLREYAKAEETYRHALVIRERIYGPENADLLATLDGLAYACFGQKKYDEAEPVYQRLLKLWTTTAAATHPMVATVLDKVAVFYGEQKKWEQANDAADRAIAVRSHFLAMGFAYQAAVKVTAEDLEAARAHYRRALAVLEPPDPLFEELRGQIEENLKAIEPPPPPAKPRKKAPGGKP